MKGLIIVGIILTVSCGLILYASVAVGGKADEIMHKAFKDYIEKQEN